MAHAVEVGDVYLVPTKEREGCGTFKDEAKGVYVMVRNVNTSGGGTFCTYDILDKNLGKVASCAGCFSSRFAEFPYYKKTNKSLMSQLTEKFILAITSEPEKSFRKAGITNGDGLLTEEGTAIFLAYLLNKNADDFKTTVVDPILAETQD